MSPDDPRHGTRRGYYAHRREDEEACEPCKRGAAAAEAWHVYNRNNGRPGRLNTLGTTRRLQALGAMGWGFLALERETGIPDSELSLHAKGLRCYIFPATAAKIAAAYDRLAMRQPPNSTPGERQAITKAKRRAERNGWLPPLAWDSIDTDPEPPTALYESPGVDPVVVMRLLEGERVKANTAERVEALAQWKADGGSEAEFCRMHGFRAGRYGPLRLVEVAS